MADNLLPGLADRPPVPAHVGAKLVADTFVSRGAHDDTYLETREALAGSRHLPLWISAAALLALGVAWAVDIPYVSPHVRHFVSTVPATAVSRATALTLLGTGLVMLLELPMLGWRNSSIYRLLHPTRSTIMDIVLYVIEICGFFGVLSILFTLGLSMVLSDALVGLVPKGAWHVSNPFLQFVLVLVVLDFAKYCWHYFVHRVPFGWEAHKFHHAATEFNVITTSRGHPLDSAIRLMFVAGPAAMLGATEADIAALTVLLSMHAGLTHSMINWRFGWIGRWILISPVAHRIHHSDQPEHFDKNLGSILIIWDRIFGTYYGGPNVNTYVNVDNNVYNRRGVLDELFDCERRVWRVLTRLPRRLLAG